jgi:signal transduction histidine kinase
MAISLFNTILLLWLGATVLLNADRRTWGIWAGGGGLLLGGAFFLSHSAILSLTLTYISRSLRFWWYASLIPIVILPGGWYVIMLWYTGFWDERGTALRRRQQLWTPLLLLMMAGGLGVLLVYANPFSGYVSLLPLRFFVNEIGGTPLLVSGYALYLILCIGLSLDALWRPGPTARVMGDLARGRARAWLIAASLLLLLISLVVIGALLWILSDVRGESGYVITPDVVLALSRLDLLLVALIALVVVVLGQAVVAYEIFTGKTLPRRGLRRQWSRALLLAAGYGALVSWTLIVPLRAIYTVLLAALLMTFFFALLGWRSYAERERTMTHLRPFVASQQLYDRLLSPPAAAAPAEIDADTPFRALCRDVLEARLAYLIPLGPLAPLAGSPLAYPSAAPAPPPSLEAVTAHFTSPEEAIVPLNPARYKGAAWAIPLWSERGLIGVLLLGEKEDGSLYTQEEMEIARASGERLIDVQAGAEMGRRLLALQRERLVESQVVDRRLRRVLHDDVLPQVHAALLAVNGLPTGDGETARQVRGETAALLGDVHRQISDLLRDFPAAVTPAVARLGVLGALRRTVDESLGAAFDGVTWQVGEGAREAARSLSALQAEVLFYAAREAIRNAARHGRGEDNARSLHLRLDARRQEETLVLLIEDDGVGMSLSEEGGQGRGLALHSTMMAVIGGALSTESLPDAYTRVRLTVSV